MSNAFISYVREDQDAVDLLAAELRREGVHVWLDRDDIGPGQFWEDTLRSAIRDGAYFLACFSEAFESREQTYMYEELRVACEETAAQRRNPGWLIPILLSPCQVPDLPIAKDRSLRDIQWVDLSAKWNEGIWKLLQIVGPRSAQSRAVDRWLRHLCQLHIRSSADRAWSMGAFRVREIEDAWSSLLLPSIWHPTLDVIVRLTERARARGIPLTDRWVEPADTGIVILTTVSPTPSVPMILDSLSPQTSGSGNAYEDFIRKERRALRDLVNWPDRDLAHWIFTLDPDDHTVDLLYWPNVRLTLRVLGLMIERRKAGTPPGPLEMMYPGSILTVTEMDRIHGAVMREEAELVKGSYEL